MIILNLLNLYDIIYDYFDVNKTPSKLSLFLQRKIENQKNREKLSCRNLAKEYYIETGKKVGKNTVNNKMKNNFGLHYLKTNPKSKFLTKDLGILYSMCFIKIFIRNIKLGFIPIFIDETKIEL